MKKHKKIFKILLVLMVVTLMTGCDPIETLHFGKKCVKCGDTYFPGYLAELVSNIIQFIQLMVPVFIIVLGMIELVKAVIAGDEKKMAESKDSVIRKFIAGIVIFLIIAVVKFIFTAVPNLADGDVDVMECLSFFVTDRRGTVDCPSRLPGTVVSMHDNDELGGTVKYESGTDPGNIKEDDDKDKDKEDDDKEEYKNIKPGYKECHGINDEEDCRSEGCQWCENYTNPDNPNKTSYCAAVDECGANYMCYKCKNGTTTTYEWSKTKHSGCTSMGKVDHNGQKIDQAVCEALRKNVVNNGGSYACYVCKDQNNKIYDYQWVSTINGAGTGCYIDNSITTKTECQSKAAHNSSSTTVEETCEQKCNHISDTAGRKKCLEGC